LCSKCTSIIKTGKDFTIKEMESSIKNKELDAQYCEKCKQNSNIVKTS